MSSVSDPPAASGAAPSVTADALPSNQAPFGAARDTGSETAQTVNPPDVDLRLGATYGKYRVIRLLGQGGMGRVYEGEDTALKRKVAIKFLPEDLVNKPVVIERFMREAQVAGRLNHPNIIAIYDVGREKKDCYIVMELLHPGSAASRIKNTGPYPWAVATRIIADCCAALKIAHEAGIVHRDIKPEKVLNERRAPGSAPPRRALARRRDRGPRGRFARRRPGERAAVQRPCARVRGRIVAHRAAVAA
ncbi:MAG: serine/threonine-protein kinase [Polyangia bacterium]